MKKFLILFFILVISYILIQVSFVYFGNGHSIRYSIVNGNYSFNVTENYISRSKLERDHYFISVDIGDIEFNYEVYDSYRKSSEIVKKIFYYDGSDYKCIYLKDRYGKSMGEVYCNLGRTIYPIHAIGNISSELRKFLDDIKEEGYNEELYLDNQVILKSVNGINVYNEQDPDLYIGFVNRDYLYKINSKDILDSVEVTDDDYFFINDKLISLSKYSNYFEITSYSLQNNSSKNTISYVPIDGYRYIGSFGKSFYFYNETSKIEYEVDSSNLSTHIASTNKYDLKYFEDGLWHYVNQGDVDLSKIRFGSKYIDDYEAKWFTKIVRNASEHGYYYYYQYENGRYNVYRSSLLRKAELTYLFSTDNYKSIKFVDNYIIYIDGNTLKSYSNKYGEKKIVSSNYINSDTIYGAYLK